MAKESEEKLKNTIIQLGRLTTRNEFWYTSMDECVCSNSYLDRLCYKACANDPEDQLNLEDAHFLLNRIRESGEFCCIKLFSDYSYIWEMSLTPSGWDKNARKFNEEDKHEVAIRAQSETFIGMILNCVIEIGNYYDAQQQTRD